MKNQKKIFLIAALALSARAEAQSIFPTDGSGVGIGTISPGALIDVNGSFHFNRPGSMVDGGNTLGINGYLRFAPVSFSPSNAAYVNLGFPDNNTVGLYTDYDGHILTSGTVFRDIQFGRINAPYLTVKDGGNVGIGTTSPGYKLDVANSARIGAQGGSDYTLITGGAGWGSRLSLYYADGTENSRLAGNNDSWLNLNYGNLGIGTTDTKGYKLAVNGSMVATAITVKLNAAWPDFVFYPNYHLKSLDELKAFVNQYRHLPDMPTAAEIDRSGINLGEMNTKLLKKVEELTLYLIQEKERNDAQRKINENLQKQIDELKQNR